MSANQRRMVRAFAAGLFIVLGVCTGARADEGLRLLMQSFDGIAATDLKWMEPKSLPPGTQMVMIYGSPDQPGPYVFRVHFPAGYQLPPHRHPDQRMVTVLKGNYWSAVGETFQQDKLKKFGPRDFYITEAGVPHYAWAETDVVIQEMGIGPVNQPIEYVNAADDPRR